MTNLELMEVIRDVVKNNQRVDFGLWEVPCRVGRSKVKMPLYQVFDALVAYGPDLDGWNAIVVFKDGDEDFYPLSQITIIGKPNSI